ncbi:pectate lyase [Paenibacillus sp. Leaf72]|uniref:pectate lyase n=1 Tax=Paenibacillus sp. Leaf72 TaxID=1736234 RepID=UPI00138F1E69|nr:pectate lyase [Paenibacillus sp. Leaf72]
MEKSTRDQQRLNTVISFADNVLKEGRGRSGWEASPLFADGIDVRTKEPVTWRFPGGREVVMSNLASQQNLFRTFVGLSRLTGDEQYENAAKLAIKFHFDHLQSECGLLQWGGHRLIDLKTLQVAGAEEKNGMVHELKNHFPYYELMYEVDPAATVKYIRALWNAHVFNWSTLEISRHGSFGLKSSRLWAHEFRDAEPFSEVSGLSFLNAGNDLIYAAGMLYKLAGEKGALLWLKRLARQYNKARNADTGLGAYQFNQARKVYHTNDDSNTHSRFGDRAGRQFGPEFGDAALEGKMLLEAQASTVYYENTMMQLQLASGLGEVVKELAQWSRQGLGAFLKYGYVPERNAFKPMLTDGTDLSGYALKRDGYYGDKGVIIGQFPATSKFLLSCVRTFIQTGDESLWEAARSIAKGNGLGDMGSEPEVDAALDFSTECDDPRALYAMLDVYSTFGHSQYLEMARKIGDNIIEKQFHFGYFVPARHSKYANFDTAEPLALLALQAAIEGKQHGVPAFIDGKGFFHANMEAEDGSVKTWKSPQLYKETV